MKNRQTKKPDPGKIPKTDLPGETDLPEPEEQNDEDRDANPDQIRKVFLDQIGALNRIIEKMQETSRNPTREKGEEMADKNPEK